jgi:hypothetical protein
MNHFEVTDGAYVLARGERDVPVEWTIGQVIGTSTLGGCNGRFIQGRDRAPIASGAAARRQAAAVRLGGQIVGGGD